MNTAAQTLMQATVRTAGNRITKTMIKVAILCMMACMVVIGSVQTASAQEAQPCVSTDGVGVLCEGPQAVEIKAEVSTIGQDNEVTMDDDFIARPCPLPIGDGVICSGPDAVDEEPDAVDEEEVTVDSNTSDLPLQFLFLPMVRN